MPVIRAFGTTVMPDTTATHSMAVAESSLADYGFCKSSGNLAIFAAIRRASSAWEGLTAARWLGRQKPNNYCSCEHEGSRNQMKNGSDSLR